MIYLRFLFLKNYGKYAVLSKFNPSKAGTGKFFSNGYRANKHFSQGRHNSLKGQDTYKYR